MSFAEQVKSYLMDIISDMSSHPWDFSNCPEKDFHRKKKLPFATFLHLFVSMQAGTVKDELLNYFSYAMPVTNSAFFQRRSKLSETALPYLFHTFSNHYPCTLYKDKYRLLAADGSSFTFTRNPLDEDSYFPPDGKTTNGYNQIHVIALMDILSKRYTDCIVQPVRKKNEFQALCSLIDRHQYSSKSVPIFIADRGFHSLNVFAHAIENKAFFLIRATDNKMTNLMAQDLPENRNCFDIWIDRILTRSNNKKKRLHPDKENLYKYIYPSVTFDFIDPQLQPEFPIRLRVLRFPISDHSYENIITNLPEDEFPLDEIKLLYHLRWSIETSFRELKYVLGAANFHSKSRQYIEMEMWARLLLYNFCSIITNDVVINRKGQKHDLQVNYSVAYKACHFLLRLHDGNPPPDIKSLIEKNTLPIRHDRNYERHHRYRIPVSFMYRFA